MRIKSDDIVFIVFSFYMLLIATGAMFLFTDKRKLEADLTKQIQALEQVITLKENENETLLQENKLLHKYIFERPNEDWMRLICAVIEIESGGNANARNKQSQGIMQINGGSFNSDSSIISGSKMLANLVAKSMNDHLPDSSKMVAEEVLHRALTSYNFGWHGANRYRAKHGHFNSDYSKKVLKKYREFKEHK